MPFDPYGDVIADVPINPDVYGGTGDFDASSAVGGTIGTDPDSSSSGGGGGVEIPVVLPPPVPTPEELERIAYDKLRRSPQKLPGVAPTRGLMQAAMQLAQIYQAMNSFGNARSVERFSDQAPQQNEMTQLMDMLFGRRLNRSRRSNYIESEPDLSQFFDMFGGM